MKKIIYILIIAAGLSSCKKFLEPTSPSEYTPQTVSALKELLLGEGYPKYTNSDRIESFMGILEDDVSAAPFVDKMTFDIRRSLRAAYGWDRNLLDTFRLQLTDKDYNIWLGYYTRIKGANLVLDYLDDVEGTAVEKASVKADALTLRAFYYFSLVNIFGKPYNFDKTALGVPLKLNGNIEKDAMPRNTVEEVYNQVLNDLNEAEREFNKVPIASQWAKNYRLGLPATQLLLSRVYLYQENWAKAAEYAEKVLANTNFSLLDLNTLPAHTATVPYHNFMDYFKNPEAIWVYGNDTDAFMFTWNTAMGTDASMPTSRTRALFKASDALLNLYNANDLRPFEYIFSDGYGGYKVPRGKVLVNNTNLASGTPAFGRMFRLSEAYLNAAEAYAKLNKPTETLNLLNKLRLSRYKSGTYTNLTGLTGDVLVTEVQNERRRELCFEGHRWFDLRRQGMPAITRIWPKDATLNERFELEKNDPSYTIRIPAQAMMANPLLIQND
ncbi:RagB/SusD family nutrient uptake outer membrane protein [Pedobacter sp. MW01-1-1]|uniref:RagB/SusD family nutrient uptake outer membrane protein n=1 Tax=Pedobacter sp. MW01-1-1 TaxID=3383027 RepID=UPI003FEE6CC5